MKNTFYFQHDYNSRNDEKLLKLRTRFGNAEGYGLFWFIIESLHEAGGYLDGSAIAELSLSYGVDTKRLQTFIQYCIDIKLLGSTNDGKLFSPRVLEHIEFRRERSESGKRGALAKWKGQNGSAVAQPMLRKGKERKEKEIGLSKESENDDETTKPCAHCGGSKKVRVGSADIPCGLCRDS